MLRRTFSSDILSSTAQQFIQTAYTQNSVHAIFEHHPTPELLDRNQITERCQKLFSMIFEQLDRITDQPNQLYELFKQLGRLAPDPKVEWLDDYNKAYAEYKL